MPSLLQEARSRIRDTRRSNRAFGLAVMPSSGATSATAELTNGHLMIEVSGGDTPSIDFDLSNERFSTIGRLFEVLSRIEGYSVQLDEDANPEHLSIDLEPFGPLSILNVGIDLRHHLFSDFELEDILLDSVRRHNPSFTPSSLPDQERPFVLQLVQANIARIQAYDASKRRGLDADVSALISLAESFERAYTEDTRRLKRALTSPKEANPNLMGEGDVVLGRVFRRSSRTGMNSPLGQNLPPDAAVLLEPCDQDIEDDNVRVNWQRNRDVDFYSYELWMDSRPEVLRIREGLIFTSTPFSFLSNDTSLRMGSERVSSAKLVFRSFGANSNFDTTAFATFVEEFGQLIRSFIVGKLEPETCYYFRLYIVDLNYETVGSNIVMIRTKALRCRFAKNYVDKTMPAIGETVTVTFDPTRGPFTADHQLKMGEKVLTTTIVTPYQVTFVVPPFVNTDIHRDLTVISPSGLIDNKRNALGLTV